MINLTLLIGAEKLSKVERAELQEYYKTDRIFKYWEPGYGNSIIKSKLEKGSRVVKVLFISDDVKGDKHILSERSRDEFTDLLRLVPSNDIKMMDLIFLFHNDYKRIQKFTSMWEFLRSDFTSYLSLEKLSAEAKHNFLSPLHRIITEL